MHVAQKFERLLDTYRHPDGRKWNGVELDKTTGGVVTRSYVHAMIHRRNPPYGIEELKERLGEQ